MNPYVSYPQRYFNQLRALSKAIQPSQRHIAIDGGLEAAVRSYIQHIHKLVETVNRGPQ